VACCCIERSIRVNKKTLLKGHTPFRARREKRKGVRFIFRIYLDRKINLTPFYNDHLGTPQAMTDASGSLVWQADYKPFGEANVPTETLLNNLRFPGQYYDAESGLHYNYFRDYDPTTGRYVQSDPIGLGGGINTFAYVGGNPMRFSDPLGLAKICKRPLSFMGELQSSGSSGTNLGIYHQQLFYEDGTDDNIGFTTTGLFDDRKNTNSYQCDSYSLDDDTIRQAEENIRQQEQWNADNYNVITNNCQDYIDVLLWEYIRLNSPSPEISGPR